jgi:ketosteroid isomerase-like protein
MSQENVEIARRSYEAWHRGDFDAVQARTAPHGKVVQLIQRCVLNDTVNLS